MTNYNKAADFLRRHMPVIVAVICLIQPVMDVLSFWLDRLGMSNTPTLLLRFAVLAAVVLFGFVVSTRKKVYYIAAAVSVVIGLGHVYACVDAGYSNPVQDLTNYVRVLQMPWTAICLISFLRCGDEVYGSMRKAAVIILFFILAVEILAQITGTEPHTYQDGSGYIGWFSNTNSQSSILDMLVPLAVVWLYIKKGMGSPLFWLSLIGGFIAMYFFGTRLCFFGIAATAFGIALSMILIRRSDWKRAVVFCVVGAIFVGLMPFSPMQKHQDSYYASQAHRQEIIDDAVDDGVELLPIDEEGISDEERERRITAFVDALTPIYAFYCADFVEIFGARRTIEMFNFSSDINTITETRPKKLQFARLLMDESPASAGIFGLELGRFTVGENIYDVENDLHGIYFLYGAVGLAAMLAFLLYFVLIIIKALIRDPKKYFTLDAAGCGIALVLCLIHVYCTAGVLRRPNASFYLAFVLACVYYLVKIKKYPDENGDIRTI